MGRISWAEVPTTLRARVEQVLGGPVVAAASQTSGWSPGSADRIRTATGERAFVKALSRGRNEDGFRMHRREALVMAAIPVGVQAPRLLAAFDEQHDGDDWAALVLDDLDGRHPTAADLPAVLDALDTLPVAPADLDGLPGVADELRDEFAAWDRMLADGLPDVLPPEVAAVATRFAETARGSGDRVDGDHLVHVDCRADNLIVDDAGTVWIVDWPWAAIGAHWLDPLTYLLDSLVRGDDVDVDHHLATHPVFAGLDPATADAVLAGLAGLFFEKAALPSPPNMPTIRAFQRSEGVAAAEWLLRRWAARAD